MSAPKEKRGSVRTALQTAELLTGITHSRFSQDCSERRFGFLSRNALGSLIDSKINGLLNERR
jgi:hypothetical protein